MDNRTTLLVSALENAMPQWLLYLMLAVLCLGVLCLIGRLMRLAGRLTDLTPDEEREDRRRETTRRAMWDRRG